MAAGRLPITEVFDGLCILVGGALLLTPGFITDGVGLLLLIPPVREILRHWASRYFASKAEFHTWTDTPSPGEEPEAKGDGPVIDGQFETVDPEDRQSRPTHTANSNVQGSSGWRRRQSPPTVVRSDDP